MTTRVFSFILALAVSLTAVSLPTDADARPAPPKDSLMQEQLIHLLTSDDAHQENRALQLVFHLSASEEHASDFFAPVTPYVAALVETGQTENLQIMAVSALHRIGTDDAREMLVDRLRTTRSYRVRAQGSRTLHALAREPVADVRANR